MSCMSLFLLRLVDTWMILFCNFLSLSFCFAWFLIYIYMKPNVLQIFSMSMWNYWPDVMCALLELVISLVRCFPLIAARLVEF